MGIRRHPEFRSAAGTPNPPNRIAARYATSAGDSLMTAKKNGYPNGYPAPPGISECHRHSESSEPDRHAERDERGRFDDGLQNTKDTRMGVFCVLQVVT